MILFLWQLPQNILGLIVLFYYRKRVAKTYHYKGTTVYLMYHDCCGTVIRWGLSLGKYIFMSELYSQELLDHEWGHNVQSKMLGPVQLIVVGIPSFIIYQLSVRNIISRKTASRLFPENWADHLGGVARRDT